MAKVTEYPRITKMKDNDILLVDGPDGTRTILQTDASKQMGGEVIMVNETAGDSTKVVINTTDEDIELATMADLEPVEEDVGGLKAQLNDLNAGCLDGTGVLVDDAFEIGNDLKTVDYSSGARLVRYADGYLEYKYQPQSTGLTDGSFSVYYTNAGIEDTDDIWIDFDKDKAQYLDYEYNKDLTNTTPGTDQTEVKILFAIKITKSDNTIARINYRLPDTSGLVHIALSDVLLSAAGSVATYNSIKKIAFSGLASNRINMPAGQFAQIKIKGVSEAREDGYNLAEKYEYVKNKAESAYDLASDIHDAATETYEIVNGDNIISDSTYMLRNGLPTYYTAMPENPTSFTDLPYIDQKIEEIPDAEKRLIYFTDCHWDDNRNGRHSPELIQYVRQRKNIPNVAFGGDYIEIQRGDGAIKGKYLARQWASDFVYRMLCTAGSAYLPIFGNHDTNYAIGETTPEYPDDVFLPYSQIRKMEFSNLPKNAHTQFEFERERIDLEEFAGANYDEFAEYLKLSYYYDDVKNKIRYIVLNSGAPEPETGPINTIFDIPSGTQVSTGAIGGLYINLIWYYNALKTVPDNYDVIILVHELVSFNGTSGYQLRNAMLAMGLKTRTNKVLYFEKKTDKLNEWCGWQSAGAKAFDFTESNPVGKVMFIIGHTHKDGIAVFKQNTAVDGSYTNPVVEWAEDQSDVSVDQNTVQTTPTAPTGYTTDNTKGCDIPVILVARDKTEDGETGTVNEQRFDVVSINANAVDLTRFGNGTNRHITFA